MKRSGSLLTAILLLAAVPWLAAADQPVEQPVTKKLVLHPQSEPRPALKYLLLPSFLDRRPGNAAVNYGRALSKEMTPTLDTERWEQIEKWRQTPLAELPKDKVREELRATMSEGLFGMLEKGSQRETIDWQLPVREENFITILLPELQHLRTFARLIALKARLEIAEGKLDEAIHTLQVGYAMARHVSQGPTLIHGLVGIAMSSLMSEQLETLVQQPGAPNLYWALAQLPDPLIDMRPGFETEWGMIYLSYPEFRDLKSKDLTPEQWTALLRKLGESLQSWGNFSAGDSPVNRLMGTGMAMLIYPEAKRRLVERGHPAEKVHAMPIAQVVLLDLFGSYDETRDDMFKWFYVEYWQGREDLKRLERKIVEDRMGNIIAGLLLPALDRARFAMAKGERTIAALRVVEGLRLYAAANEGRLPEKLADVQVPLPIDPVTGNPFVYSKQGDTAILEGPIPPDMTRAQDGLRYEITMASKGDKR